METGETLTKVISELKNLGAKSVEVAVLLRKAKAKKHDVKPTVFLKKELKGNNRLT